MTAAATRTSPFNKSGMTGFPPGPHLPRKAHRPHRPDLKGYEAPLGRQKRPPASCSPKSMGSAKGSPTTYEAGMSASNQQACLPGAQPAVIGVAIVAPLVILRLGRASVGFPVFWLLPSAPFVRPGPIAVVIPVSDDARFERDDAGGICSADRRCSSKREGECGSLQGLIHGVFLVVSGGLRDARAEQLNHLTLAGFGPIEAGSECT